MVIAVVGETKSVIKFWDLVLNTLLGVFAAETRGTSFIVVFEEEEDFKGFRWT